MADQRYANILQILDDQGGQEARVDLIRTKCRLVMFEPEAAEPCRNVHARLAGVNQG